MTPEINVLTQKIDSFIKKYYKNQLIKGGILASSLILITFLISVLLEYFGQFNTLVRTFIFYTYWVINLPIIIKYLLIPLLKLQKLGVHLSQEQASIILGKYFPEIKDKLLNTILLSKQVNQNFNNIDLLTASIDQKIKYLKPISFNKINVSINAPEISLG